MTPARLQNYQNIKIKYTQFFIWRIYRIYQSFKKFEECFNSNSIGTNAVFKFCLENNIKLIYSATSATLGNGGNDKNLSPYAFTKSKNLELLENLKTWFILNMRLCIFIMFMVLDILQGANGYCYRNI